MTAYSLVCMPALPCPPKLHGEGGEGGHHGTHGAAHGGRGGGGARESRVEAMLLGWRVPPSSPQEGSRHAGAGPSQRHAAQPSRQQRCSREDVNEEEDLLRRRPEEGAGRRLEKRGAAKQAKSPLSPLHPVNRYLKSQLPAVCTARHHQQAHARPATLTPISSCIERRHKSVVSAG